MEDELTAAQLERDLRNMAEALELGLERSADAEKPVDIEEPIGRVSRIDAIAQREISQAGRRQQAQQLGPVRSAILAIEEGEVRLVPVVRRTDRLPTADGVPTRSSASRARPSARKTADHPLG